MSEKITIQDIVELLAEKHSMTKKDAETFVKGMFELIEEALATEKYVKVKGLGTFKLTEVGSRESVNVNTGERIEIQGHTKISFTPDTTMKDLINKPFAHFETVILNENTQLEDTATEIENEEDKEETPEPMVANVPEEAIPEETVTTEAVTMEEEAPVEVPPVDEPVAEEPSTPASIAAAEEPQSAEEEAPAPEAEIIPEEKAPRKTPWGIIIAIILALCIAGGICWYLQKDKAPVPPAPVAVPAAPAVQPQKPDSVAIPVQDSLVHPKDTVAVTTPAVPVKRETLADTVEYDITGTMASHTLKEGESLAKLAARFYGSKKLWPYIVKYNKDIIKDADRVPIGTTLRIPQLTPKK